MREKQRTWWHKVSTTSVNGQYKNQALLAAGASEMPQADLGIALPFYEKAIITAEKEEGKKTSREVVRP